MSKYQEVLNYLDWYREVSHTEHQKLLQEKLLQELVDKEVPIKLTNKRPCFRGVIWGDYKCGNEIGYNKYLQDVNYRSSCGQKLDWRD